ncbi:hypothetical protein CFter6_0491 [Collimonas fungivorans]|uniref:Uncharacterized protein n=1 Tax=Collimonas fungivorans TaxID=158899 RepID=A0A127P5V7_9BURK|nr:hypothetical protein CFter6_0491 [Collimonas fungivorans]
MLIVQSYYSAIDKCSMHKTLMEIENLQCFGSYARSSEIASGSCSTPQSVILPRFIQ